MRFILLGLVFVRESFLGIEELKETLGRKRRQRSRVSSFSAVFVVSAASNLSVVFVVSNLSVVSVVSAVFVVSVVSVISNRPVVSAVSAVSAVSNLPLAPQVRTTLSATL